MAIVSSASKSVSLFKLVKRRRDSWHPRSSLSNEPPGRFGSKEDSDEEGNRPHPLKRIRNAVCPLIGSSQHRLDDSDADHLTEAPTEVDVGRQVATKGDGADSEA